MVAYEKSKIYKIESISDSEYLVYIGATCETLYCRMKNYKKQYERWKAGDTEYISLYELFDKFGIDGCKITLLEKYPCISKMELDIKKGEYIKILDCLNKVVSGRTHKEYREDNKEKIKAQNKEYRSRPEVMERNKEYYKKNKDIIKEYLEKKKDIIKEKRKEYYQRPEVKERERLKSKAYRDKKKLNAT